MMEAVKIWRRAKKNYKYLGKRGTVESLTKIVQAPAGYEEMAPYWVGVIRLRCGKKVTAQLVGGEEIRIGSKVFGALRRVKAVNKSSVIEYGIKFKKT